MSFKVLFPAAAAMMVSLGAMGASAATIDLAAEGFVETSTVYDGSGGVYYDEFSLLFTEDIFFPLGLDDFAFSEVFMAIDSVIDGNDTVSVFYDGFFTFGHEELFTVTATGNDSLETLEFLLSRDSADLPVGATRLGENAILRISSAGFDFGTDPFAFFAGQGSKDYAVDISLTALAPIPVPASLPLLIAGLGGLGLAARRKRKTTAR